jgi:hypothetical protein
MTETVFILLGSVGPLAICVALVVVGLLSSRLGAVTKMPPYYRWFFVAAGLVLVSVVTRLMLIKQLDDTLLLIYNLLLAAGVTLALWWPGDTGPGYLAKMTVRVLC